MKLHSFGSRVMVALAGIMVASTATEAGLFKASPAPVSEFIENRGELIETPRVPFNKYWRNPSPQAWARVDGFDKIMVAPVSLKYLRGRSDMFCRYGRGNLGAEAKLALYTQDRFQQQLIKGRTYTVVENAGPRTLILELALVELNPVNIAGNVAKTGAGVFVPGASFVGGQFTKGRIAIEGKLRNAETGEVLVEFADSEQNKLSLVSFRDFAPYAHAREAIEDWAKQFDRLSRTTRGERIRGASRVTLSPF